MAALRRFARIALVTITIFIGVVVIALLATRTVIFHDWLRRYVTSEIASVLNGDVSIGRLNGNLLTGVELDDVRIMQAGKPVVLIRNVGLRYNVIDFITTGIVIDSVRITQPRITLVRSRDGWNVASLVKAQRQEADRQGPARTIRIAEIGVSDGAVTIDDQAAGGTSSAVRLPASIDRIDLAGSYAYEPVRMTIRLGHVSFRASRPDLALNSLSGQISVRNDDVFLEKLAVRTAESSVLIDGEIRHYLETPAFNIAASSDKLTVREFGGLVPALAGSTLQPALEVKTAGPLSDLQLEANVRSSAGNLKGHVRGDMESEARTARGSVQIAHVDPGRLLNRSDLAGDVTADATFDVRGTAAESLGGRVDISAPSVRVAGYQLQSVKANAVLDGALTTLRASARGYGASATIRGRITRTEHPSAPITYDVEGQLANVDLQKLPLPSSTPRLSTILNSSYKARGSGSNVVADLQLARSTVEGATIQDGTTLHVATAGATISYAAAGGIAQLDPQRIGRALHIDNLSEDRFHGQVNASFNINGSGRTIAELAGHADARLQDSTLLGGHIPDLLVSADVRQHALEGVVRGRLDSFDPASLTGRADLTGSVAGTADLTVGIAHLTRPSDLAGLQARGDITVAPSKVGALEIQSASVRGAVAHETAAIERAHLESAAGTVDAAGDVALGEQGSSTLTYDVALTDLAQLGKIAGVDVAGTGRLAGSVRGNAASLGTRGTLSGSHLRYGTTASAMSVTSHYDARVPDVDVHRAEVSADTTAAFVEAGGQQIREVVAKSSYAPGEATLDATASDETRSVSARARARLLDGTQDVDVQELAFRSGKMAWSTPPNSDAHVRYDGKQVSIERLALVNGDQRIEASGVLALEGPAGPSAPAGISVKATNVDLATLEDLTIADRGLAGRLTAEATLAGSLDEPHAKGQAWIDNGAFRNFRFQALNATVDYDTRGALVDLQLRQNEAASLSVRGSVPVAELRGQPAPRDAYPLDVRVESSPIELGLVQGVTTALRDVTGTFSGKVHVTGSVHAPRLDGELSVQNGAFMVDPLETAYNQLNAHVVFAGDQVRIDRMRLLDDGGDPLDVTGGVVLKERQLGTVDVRAKANHFRVMSGQLADLQANLDLHVAGEPLSPRVEGDVEVQEGRLEIDRILANLQTGLYATESQDTSRSGATAGAPPAAVPAPSNVAFDVRLRVPDNLIVRGDDVRIGGRGMTLGNVNITLGGDIRATKAAGTEPRVTGEIRTIRGFYDFEGRRFDVARDGHVTFNGPDPTDPALDITATRDISGVEASIRVHGTVQQPAIALSSTPPLEEADVLSLIVFNRPINDLGQGERTSLAQTAQSVVGGMVAAPLAESLRNALNVDLLEIQAVSNEGGPGVTVGNQLSERVYLQFRQLFGSAATTQVVLEYQLSEHFRIQSAFTEGGTDGQAGTTRPDQTGVDLIWTIKR